MSRNDMFHSAFVLVVISWMAIDPVLRARRQVCYDEIQKAYSSSHTVEDDDERIRPIVERQREWQRLPWWRQLMTPVPDKKD